MAAYTDNFNRANNSALGSPWVESEADTAVHRIDTNRLSALRDNVPSALPGYAYYNAVMSDDQYSQLKWLSAEGTAAGGRLGVGARLSGAYSSMSGYLAGYLHNTDVGLFKLVNQSLASTYGTQLGSLHTVTLAANDVLRIEVNGDQISVKLNGNVIIGPITDSAIASGKAGVFAACRVDAQNVVSFWDDWAGGDVKLTELEDTKTEINTSKEALENVLSLCAAGLQAFEDALVESKASTETTDDLRAELAAVREAFEFIKADIRASMDFSDVSVNVVVHAFELVDLLTAAAGGFPAIDNVKIEVGQIASESFSDLLAEIRAAVTAFAFMQFQAAAARPAIEDGIFLHVGTQALPDFSGPFLRQFPFPKPGATNVLLNAPVVIRIRDEGRGVDIDTVWVEIEGVKYLKGDPEFTYEEIDAKKEYLITVRPAADWLPNKVITVRAYGEDLAGNPGLKMERE